MSTQDRAISSQPKKKHAGKKHDEIYAHLFDAILEHRLAPGIKLSEEALGEIFGVSRTIIRRELLQLAHEGVVSMRPNRGAMVANPTIEEARQILQARRIIEKAVTELAAQNATKEQVQQLRQMIQEEKACFDRGETGTAIRLSGEFHLRLAEVAGNKPLIGFQRSLVSQTSLIIAQYERVTVSHCSFDEHTELVDAIAAGDARKASDLMMHHMDHIEAKLHFEDESTSQDLHSIFSYLSPDTAGQ
ncbi:GntR family transcriptional regulator [Marinobacter sp. VGCF2001]|uniref:GntR family transcriptional regulator n=1 Tax=Marinobacter sp. VGCF2001 TaxID=3417189 RepID=UPI003CF1EE87